MENANVIARVYAGPHDNKRRASTAIKASKRYVVTHYEEEDTVQYGRYDRAATELPDDDNATAHLDMPHLEIKFSDIPRTSHGIVFGCDPDSDVVLPNLKGISKHHFSLTFDDANRLIVRDWGSLLGTEVTYDGEGRGTRSNFRWIIHSTVEFQVVAAKHDVNSQEYIGKVYWFRQGTATAEDLFRDLDVPQRPDTELPTGAHTPGRGEIHLRREIGEGSYGVVTHFWNVSDGSEYALKEPTARAIRKRQVNYDEWRREARLMGQISHVPSIPRNIHVMFGDFGVARDSSELSTFCGSGLYLAPEVYLEWQSICSNTTRKKYTPAVDVWSLGVVALELKCGLPRYRSSYLNRGTVWCEKVVKAFHQDYDKWPDALGHLLLNNMLVIAPDSRASARNCYTLAAILPHAADGGCSTPGRIPHADEEQTTIRHDPTGYGVDNQGTTVQVPMPRAVNYTAASYEAGFVRSTAPPPDTLPSTSMKSLKRTATLETPSHLSTSPARRTTKRREGGSHRGESACRQDQELTHFLQDYSSDPLDPLYVGSSLASWAPGGNSSTWDGQSSNEPARQCQLDHEDAQIGSDTALLPVPIMSTIPRSPWEACDVEDEVPVAGISDGVQMDEGYMAALLLQAMSQGVQP
ncbi:hypothetical protein ACCO45_004472 [Purpureocillium lilacinum]|uniref:Uncharacterized protein n=1 Tax=Purpureocillium lilacinum TaxID=33203 RepID=A0ACC4E488_PURLI